MATWIVHLRLAENLLTRLEGLDPAAFAIGNVAPDSGMPDEKWENFDPPGKVTHFHAPPENFWRCADLAFYRTCLAPVSHDGDAARFSFLLGYFFHLIADNLWYEEIAIPTKAKFAKQFAADPKFIWEVKRDWYGLDFQYVRTRPDSIFWQVFLHSEYTQSYLDFLPQKAIRHNLNHIKTFYRKDNEHIENRFIKRPNLYLSEQEMDTFVENATVRLAQIYQAFWNGHAVIPEGTSALEL